MTDEELWGQSLAGDGTAFGLLFERHAQAVFAYCPRRAGAWAVAEDLMSVVFMETWRKRTSVAVEGPLLPWLYTVALNVTRNHQRARTRYKAALGKVPPHGAHDDHDQGGDRRASEAGLRRADRDAEHLGDLRLAQVRPRGHLQHLTVPGGSSSASTHC